MSDAADPDHGPVHGPTAAAAPVPGYPPARRGDDVEDLPAGAPVARVADPYRWLEDASSEETAAWAAAQDALLAEHRAGWEGRDAVVGRLAGLLGAGSVGVPVHRGARRFSTRREPGAEHAVLLVREPADAADPDGAQVERVLVDPVAVDPSGLTTLDAWQPSLEGDLLAYQLSEGGSEESALRVLDVATGEVVDGPLDRTRYSPVAWLPGGTAFYCVRRLAPDLVPDGEEQFHRRVVLHEVGGAELDEVEVFGAGRDLRTYYGVSVSRDGRWLSVTAAVGTDPRTDVWLADLGEGSTAAAAPPLREVVVGEDAATSAGVRRDGRLYVSTDLGAPRGRLAVADPHDPRPDRWRDLLAERDDAVLEGWTVLDGPGLGDAPVLLAAWTTHAVSRLTVHDLADGALRGEVALPGTGTVGGLVSRPEGGHEAWFVVTDPTTLPHVHRYDARTGEVAVVEGPPGDAADAVGGDVPTRTQQLEVTSADGTTVRVLVTARTDALDADGRPLAPAPLVLYGYGGFGISLPPTWSAGTLAWVRSGGVWAVAGLRGGGEEGEEWHRAGMGPHKPRVYEDLEAAADALTDRGWTTTDRLGIYGGSNGGLLVGAALTRRPAGYRAVVCSAPLLDMVRYQLHGLGRTWAGEYGDAEDAEQLGWLLAHSPYHHVRADEPYPATLFTVFDGDSRVDPLHARKLCAALQAATSRPVEEAPVLLRREADVGHGARSVTRSTALTADVLAFLGHELGLDVAAVPPAVSRR
ncbi:prolyl oligopeptidase [Pseudokineococcus lusitanus]|uniref:prolyl oligopeptidase n=1 Tax=Pseudokineococcus lusitanus TaxID=763993 RepID=A0A3N1HTZ4_9ACTN|nr:prolyl oligopeptidase family serine peptidase [Pseudokineococcus lusitanus]ROP45890.1 prolyl oligopeptidase [Pseudokineococcus lusitanus]